MNVEYGYAIVIPVAVFIAGWCFYDTTCRGKCRRRREPESESDTESEEKLEEDIP